MRRGGVLHKHKFLSNAIVKRLRCTPSCLLGDLSHELCVSKRTLERAVTDGTDGKTFRKLKDEILVEQVKGIFSCHPTPAIKELSFNLGFKFPRSFARALKRASGYSPEEFRSIVISELLTGPQRAMLKTE